MGLGGPGILPISSVTSDVLMLARDHTRHRLWGTGGEHFSWPQTPWSLFLSVPDSSFPVGTTPSHPCALSQKRLDTGV